MSKIHTTLHPQNDESVELYPNVESENIPNGSISKEKLDTTLQNEIDNKVDSEDVYSISEINTMLNNKADKSQTYNKEEIDGLLYGKANIGDVYSKNETDALLSQKADITNVYTKSQTYDKTEVTNLLEKKADKTNTYTKTETFELLSAKADKTSVYTKGEIDNNFAPKSTTYTKGEVDGLLEDKADKSTTYTKTEIDTVLSGKQSTLVSGTNIKTINGQSLLGSGDLTVGGGDDGCKALKIYEDNGSWYGDTTIDLSKLQKLDAKYEGATFPNQYAFNCYLIYGENKVNDKYDIKAYIGYKLYSRDNGYYTLNLFRINYDTGQLFLRNMNFYTGRTGTIATLNYVGSESLLQGYQARLVSGTNIKTVNGQSLLGSGDLTVGVSARYEHTIVMTTSTAQNNKQIKCLSFKVISSRSTAYTLNDLFTDFGNTETSIYNGAIHATGVGSDSSHPAIVISIVNFKNFESRSISCYGTYIHQTSGQTTSGNIAVAMYPDGYTGTINLEDTIRQII